MTGFAAQLAVALKAVDMYRSLGESERQLREYAEELQASMEVQHRLARTDALTGIPNRRYVDEVTKGECSRAVRHKTPLCVALVDIESSRRSTTPTVTRRETKRWCSLAIWQGGVAAGATSWDATGATSSFSCFREADLGAATRFVNRFRTTVAGHVFVLSLQPEHPR